MSYASTPQPAAGPKRLVRRSDNSMIGGVCSGVATYLGVDVTLVRVLTVLGVIFGLGSAAQAEQLTVRWPSGQTQTWRGADLGVDRYILLAEDDEGVRPGVPKAGP